MEPSVMAAVRRFVPQQKPVRARVKERLVALPAALPDGKRNGAFGKPRFDFTDDGAEAFICKIRVLAALQNKGAKAEAVPPARSRKGFPPAPAGSAPGFYLPRGFRSNSSCFYSS